jgi:uncharacterized protein (TIGR02145 family)
LYFLCAILTGLQAQTLKDIDNNVYDTIRIGTQTWMKQNLKVTKFNDGTAIKFLKESEDWSGLPIPGYCWYNNDEAMYKNIYGALYNWWVADVNSTDGKNVCPVGWHVPTYDEWTNLITYLGGEAYAGGKLKDTSTFWQAPNKEATNESGFTALPVGCRNTNGTFSDIGQYGWWWSSTETDPGNGWIHGLGYDFSSIGRGSDYKRMGHAIRCLKN